MRPTEARAELEALGVVLVVVLAVVLAAWLAVLGLTHRAPPRPGQPEQLTRAQYCGPAPSYYPGVKHGARPAGC